MFHVLPQLSESGNEPPTEPEAPARANSPSPALRVQVFMPSKRGNNSEPELHGRIDVNRLSHIKAQHRPFYEADPANIDTQSQTDGMRNRTQGVAIDIAIAHVVEGRGIDIANSHNMIEAIP